MLNGNLIISIINKIKFLLLIKFKIKHNNNNNNTNNIKNI